jgi:phage FluMu protein Com
MVRIKDVAAYPANGYMIGRCPSCKEWEAPITKEELINMRDNYAHHGTSDKTIDKRAEYHRETWREFFQCPKCKKRYSVPFSST